jgi:Fe-S-cluster containining protein
MSQPTNIPFPQSPVVPTMVGGEHVIQFSCHKGIGCWNACCANIDITLTPYDILRLKKRLELSSAEFLTKYTVPYELDKDDIAGVKFRPVAEGTACQFMTPEGCSVYEDRPTACRYYPVALLSMRKEGENFDTASYALVEEEHCKGHAVPRKLTIDEYRKEQGLDQYDELARGWRQLVLKKKSSGPTIGKPSLKSRQLFFMACYDLDQFRAFVASEGFGQLFSLPLDERQKIVGDDVELLQFGFRFLRQVLFGEESIPLNDAAAKERIDKVKEKQMQIEREAAERLARAEEGDYPFEDHEE